MGNSQSFAETISRERDKIFPGLSNNLMEDSPLRNFFNNPLSDDLLLEILSFVPDKDLILNCQLVCKQWKELISGHSIWRLKCERENIELPKKCRTLSVIPKHHYRYMYLYSKSEKNLLKNPCGEDNLLGWHILQSNGDGLITESPPAGCDPVPAEVGANSCFATSYGHCAKFQVVDLYEKEYNKHLLLNNLVSKIHVGEWYAARFDCGSVYELKVELLNDSSDLVDHFTASFECQQWNGSRWDFVDYEFPVVSNVRYVHFEHSGKDTQFWAGHYGSKFTGGFVKLCLS